MAKNFRQDFTAQDLEVIANALELKAANTKRTALTRHTKGDIRQAKAASEDYIEQQRILAQVRDMIPYASRA